MQSAAEKDSSSTPLACMQRAVASANQRPLGRVPGYKTPRKTEKVTLSLIIYAMLSDVI